MSLKMYSRHLGKAASQFSRRTTTAFASRGLVRGLQTSPSTRKNRPWTLYAVLVPTTAAAAAAWLFTHQTKTKKPLLLESPEIQGQRADPLLNPQAREAANRHTVHDHDHHHHDHHHDPDTKADTDIIEDLPRERAILTTAPNIPPAIKRTHPVLLEVHLETTTKETHITPTHKYAQWTFNNSVPGPFIRARVNDTIELSLTNRDESGNPHNIDCHAFLGPGGGAPLTTVSEGETKTARFKLLCPGLYLYHCAAAPVPVHIANGMYGLIYVQGEKDTLPAVDREFYVMQSEFYHEPPEKDESGRLNPTVEFSYPDGLREEASVVVFNGHEGALTMEAPLKARVGETVRIYFGNAGPNLTSSFHVIGSNFLRLYRDGDVVSPPGRFVSTTSVPPGGAVIADMAMVVPGTYALVDHAIFRLEKGCVGYLNVSGEERKDVYTGFEQPEPCVGCKLHP